MKRLPIFIFSAIVATGCSTITSTYLNNEMPYAQYIGKRYELIRDCYLYKSDGKRPEIGAHVDVLGEGDSDLPKEVTPSYVDKQYGTVFIQSIVKSGAVFRVVNIRKDEEFEGTLICYEIDFEKRGLGIVDAFFILHRPVQKGSYPTISPLFAKQIDKIIATTRSTSTLSEE